MGWEGRWVVEGAWRSLFPLCSRKGAAGPGMGMADTTWYLRTAFLPLFAKRAPIFSTSQCAQVQDESWLVQITYAHLFASASDWPRSRHMTPPWPMKQKVCWVFWETVSSVIRDISEKKVFLSSHHTHTFFSAQAFHFYLGNCWEGCEAWNCSSHLVTVRRHIEGGRMNKQEEVEGVMTSVTC